MKKRINITVDEFILKKVDEMAKNRGIDRSTMFSILVYDAQLNELLSLYKKNEE